MRRYFSYNKRRAMSTAETVSPTPEAEWNGLVESKKRIFTARAETCAEDIQSLGQLMAIIKLGEFNRLTAKEVSYFKHRISEMKQILDEGIYPPEGMALVYVSGSPIESHSFSKSGYGGIMLDHHTDEDMVPTRTEFVFRPPRGLNSRGCIVRDSHRNPVTGEDIYAPFQVSGSAGTYVWLSMSDVATDICINDGVIALDHGEDRRVLSR